LPEGLGFVARTAVDFEPMSATDNDPLAPASRANTFPWPPVLFVACIMFAWLAGRYAPLAWPGVNDLPARIIGISFGIAGVVLIVWAILTLNRASTTVMPHKRSDHLVTSGPYTRFRNPIYLGEVLLQLCLAELTKNIYFVLGALLFVVSITQLQILAEERHLLARFGDAYASYRARSRRWI
jgi:protein-S-isoprenylcysteine O-methyltransferase Ste14